MFLGFWLGFGALGVGFRGSLMGGLVIQRVLRAGLYGRFSSGFCKGLVTKV